MKALSFPFFPSTLLLRLAKLGDGNCVEVPDKCHFETGAFTAHKFQHSDSRDKISHVTTNLAMFPGVVEGRNGMTASILR